MHLFEKTVNGGVAHSQILKFFADHAGFLTKLPETRLTVILSELQLSRGQSLDEDEFLDVVKVKLEDAVQLVMDGKLPDASPDARKLVEDQILEAYTRHIEQMQAEAEAEEAGFSASILSIVIEMTALSLPSGIIFLILMSVMFIRNVLLNN